jgi:hypothetical protein
MPFTAPFGNLPSAAPVQPPTTVYYLVWRTRASHPWHSEELFNRIDAHKRYLALIERGVEAYLQRRRPAWLSA